jgi:Transglutaminase-like superfamily
MVFSARTLDGAPSQRDMTTISCDRQRPIEPASSKMRFISKVVLFLRIFAFAAAVPYLLRLKLSRVASAIEHGRAPSAVHDEDSVRRITAYVEIAIRRGRPLVRPGCLTRGLTRYYFLRRSGVDVALCFGMGRLAKEFIGHCWLVKDGEPFLEAEDPRPRYVETYRISPASSRASVSAGANGLRRFSDS